MVRFGVLCPSDIAYKRFMPALSKISDAQFCGVGINSVQERYGKYLPDKNIQDEMLERQKIKADCFISEYGGRVYKSYQEIALSDDIDALYIPLPPALHYKWAKIALKSGKHVMVEKPSTISGEETRKLIDIADGRGLAFHENYMFVYHQQLVDIDKIIRSGEIGDVRLYRVRFGFPRRTDNDFRYNKGLGGGSLIDAGGYTIRYAAMLLGESARFRYAQLNYVDDFSVDMYGSGALSNEDGVTAQISFGMDNDYKCELEVWGSKGTLLASRVLTAPESFVPKATISINGRTNEINLSADDAFFRSIGVFMKAMTDRDIRKKDYRDIQRQADLVEQFRIQLRR